MLKTAQIVISATPLIAFPALAVNGEIQTGVTSIGPAMFCFTLAIALLLTLVFRAAAAHLTRFVARRLGELRVRAALRKHSTAVLHDFIVPGAYGGLAKIDHAVLTAGGILCVQTKHCNGVIFGTEDDPQWTHVEGVNRRRFLNPVIQNTGRTRALQSIVPDIPVANVVIFSGAIEFSSPPPNNVIRVTELASYVAKFVLGPSKVKDWDAAWMSIQAAALTDEATRKDFQAQLGFS